MKIYDSIEQLIGKTPLLRLKDEPNILLKLEMFNPAGSAKDRPALEIIKGLEESGKLKPGGTIIEETSGNTGIGLALVSAIRGYKFVAVMPDTMSEERIKMMKAYGAEVVLSDGKLGMDGAAQKAFEIQEEIPGSVIAGQFDNYDNSKAHYLTTGPEIWEDTDGKVDIFVAGIGTGGTISGTGKYLKEKNPDIKVIGIEPSDSPLITKGIAGPHKLQGIGANFVPKILNMDVIDEIVTVTAEDAYAEAKRVARENGALVGITSGAAVSAARKLAKENPGKTIVVILTDTGTRYLSTEGFI